MFWGQCTLCPSPRFDQTYFGAQKNRLIETVVLILNNMFWLRNRKTNFQLRALICRSGSTSGGISSNPRSCMRVWMGGGLIFTIH